MRNTLLLLFSLFTVTAFAQKPQLKYLIEGKTNFKEIEQIAENYFAHKAMEKGIREYDDNEWVKYQRWHWFWESRVHEDGSFPDLNAQFEIYRGLNPGGSHKKSRALSWSNISQTTASGGYHGMGRLITVAFHPTDTNILYVGAPTGGIWKTVDGGNTWIPLGDQLPYCSVGNILVDHTNPSTLYISVGQNEGWWHYGLGIYKSTDGGQSWNPTTQTTGFLQHVVYYKMLMDPADANVIYSAQSNGIWKTQDGGNSWYKIRNGTHVDLEFKPGNAQTLYAAFDDYYGSSEIYRSTDTGATWTKISNLNQTKNKIEIAVTPADTNYIGMGVNGESANYFYLSTDGGAVFQLKNNAIDDNAVIMISPLTKSKIYCGYVSNYRSNNSGTTWSQITNWYNDGILPEVHADNHYAAVNPLQPQYIYYCNDGGLYRYKESNNTWKDLSDGLIITQFYKIALSAQDSVFMIGGTQDNGGRKREAINSWGSTNGGDGMQVAINPVNDETMYTSYWGGTLYRSYDRWVNDTYHDITADTAKGAWVTPYMIDPNNESKLVAAYADVWVSPNEGDAWTTISSNLTGTNSKLEVLDVARGNSNVIYTGRSNKLYHTSNFGSNWTTYTVPGLTAESEKLTCVRVHPKNPDHIYITKGGYGVGSKVYRSADHGQSFTNITYNIPNVPVNCILVDVESDSSNTDLYIGTDVGVFYKKDSDITWQYYGTGMPNTQVSDLQIFYPTGTLRAGTYGRGIWQTQIARPVSPLAVPGTQEEHFTLGVAQNPVGAQIEVLLNSAVSAIFEYTLTDLSGKILHRGILHANPGMNTKNIPADGLASGIYLFQLSKGGRGIQTLKIIKN